MAGERENVRWRAACGMIARVEGKCACAGLAHLFVFFVCTLVEDLAAVNSD